jgi:hypothetical protein
MEKQTVYVETTIPSAIVSTRGDAGSVFRKRLTERWWNTESSLSTGVWHY